MNTLGEYRYGYPRMGFGEMDRTAPLEVDQGTAPVLQGMQIAQQQQGNQQRLQMNALAMQQAQQQVADQQQVNQLASQLYSEQTPDKNRLLGKIAAIDPAEAAQLQRGFASQSAEQRAQHAAAMQDVAQQFASIAQMPPGQQQSAAYQAMLDRMRATGKDVTAYENAGPQVGARMALARIADAKTLLGIDGMGAQPKPNIDSGYQIITGPDGRAQAVPIPIAGGQAPPSSGPAGGGFSASVPGANGSRVAFNFPPGTPPQVIAAAKADAVANGDVAPGAFPAPPQAGAPATLADALHRSKGAAGAFSTMTPDQVAAAGLPKGTVAQVGANGQIHILEKPGGTNGEAQTFGDTSKTGDAYLQTLTPEMQRQVVALDQGRMQFPSSFALKTPYWQGVLQAVGQYDPSFDAVNFNSRNQARKNFTSGKEANQVNALNTVAQHLGLLRQDASALNNRSIPAYNAVANAVESAGGAPQLTNFERDRLPVVQELERVWRGTGGSEADIQQWTKNLSSASSPQQFDDAFKHISTLIHGKLVALRNQYLQGMGNTHDPYAFLSPQTRQIFASLGQPAGNEGTAPGEGPHTDTGAPAAGGRIAVNPQTGERVQWNGSAWVPAQ